MFLLVNLLLIEDASLTSLQTEGFCLQNRYKTSSGRERVSATHTVCSDQQDHPKRERSVWSLASLLTAAAWEPISALCQSKFQAIWSLSTCHQPEVNSSFSFIFYRVLLTTTLESVRHVITGLYHMGHSGNWHFQLFYQSPYPVLSLFIYLHQSPLHSTLNQGGLSKQFQLCFILPRKLTCSLSPSYWNLCPFFSFPVGTYLPLLPFQGNPNRAGRTYLALSC